MRALTNPRCSTCHTVMWPRLDARTHDRPAVTWHECGCGHSTERVLTVPPARASSALTSSARLCEAATC